MLEFESTKLDSTYDRIATRKGFEKTLLTDVNRIPITEDYTNIHTYLAEFNNLKNDEIDFIWCASGGEFLVEILQNL